MAMGVSGDGIFRCIYEGCISGCNTGIERRPYHRNCGCALHKSGNNNNCSLAKPKCKNVSYPIRRSWSEGNCLAMMASYTSPSPPSSSTSSSPALTRKSSTHQLGFLCGDEEESN